MVGMVLACLWWARSLRRGGEPRASALHLMDALALVSPPGILLGRLANFVNGELLGRTVAGPGEPAPWWSVRFPQELLEPNFAPVLTVEQQNRLTEIVAYVQPQGGPEIMALREAIRRIQSGDIKLESALTPLLSARHPSQLYQGFAEGVVTFAVLWWIWRVPRKPGVMLAWFLIVYGVGRIATEFWRLPDAHLIVPRIAGLSRGQWLSAAMVVIGTVVLWWVTTRSKAPAMGGWRVTPR